MWWAINGMSKEVHELVQGDAGTDGVKDTEPVLASENLAEEELVPTTESSIDPQPNSKAAGPTLFHKLFTIPEEDVLSVKDSTWPETKRGCGS